MSTTRVITMICWIVSALVLIGLLVWFLTGSIFGIGGNNMTNWFSGISIGGTENLSGPFQSQGTQTADITNMHSININWVAGEVTVIPHDGNEIRVTEFAQRDLRDNERLRMSTDNGTLTVRYREQASFTGSMPRKNLEVLVPHSLSGNLTNLSINTTSGSVITNNFEATTAKISSVSASIDVANIVSQTTDINTTSGAITAASIRTGKLDTSSVSGALTATQINAATVDISTTSGSTNMSGEFDRIDVSSVSGSTTIRSTTVPSRMDVSSVSGAIDVYIPNEGEITVSHSAVSGRFSSEVPVIIQSGGAYKFSSVSGNTNIHALN